MKWVDGTLRFHVDEYGISKFAFLEKGKEESETLLLDSGDELLVWSPSGAMTRFKGLFVYHEIGPYKVGKEELEDSKFLTEELDFSRTYDQVCDEEIAGFDEEIPNRIKWIYFFTVKRLAQLLLSDLSL